MNIGKGYFIITLVKECKVDTVYISYKDRFTRFGFGYFDYIFNLFGTKIEVVNLTKEEDFQQELTQDFISIIHYFSMKLYSNRRKQLKQLKNELEQEQREMQFSLKITKINNIRMNN